MKKRHLLASILCLLSITAPAQTDHIKIKPASKYYYQVQNVSVYPLTIQIGSSLNKDSILIPAEKFRRLESSQVDQHTQMSVHYSRDDYLEREKWLWKKYLGYELADSLSEDLHEWYQKRNLKGLNKQNFSSKATGSLIAFVANYYLNKYVEEQIDILENSLFHNRRMYEGSIKLDDELHKKNFASRKIYQYVKTGKNAKRGLVNKFGLDATVPLYKSNLSNHWGRSKSSFAVNTSVMLSPEFRWGKVSNIFSRLHVMLDYQSDFHNLENDGDSIFVLRDYVENPTQSLYAVISDKNPSLNIRNLSIGVFLRTSFNTRILVDLGLGYYIRQKGLFIFDKDEQHLELDGQLKDNKFKDVLSSNDNSTSNYYTMVNVAWFPRKPASGAPNKRFYYAFKFRAYKRDLSPSASNQLVRKLPPTPTDTGPVFQQLPLTDNPDKWRVTIHIGIGFAF